MSSASDRARRRMRRMTVLSAALAALAVPGSALAAPEVKIAPEGEKAVTVDLAELAGREDVRNREYTVRSKKQGDDKLAITGFSLRLILEEGGVKDDFFSVSVKGKGPPDSLSRDAALDEGSGAEGPPVIYAKGNDLGFLRPSTGPKDYNGDEAVGAAGSLTVAVITDATLDVKASASDRSVEKGDKVKFNAKADLPSGERATYTWHFGDGDSSKGQDVDHTFKSEGTFSVRVTAETPGGAEGTSETVSVKVEDKKSENKDKDGNGGGSGDGGSGSGSGGTGDSPVTTPEIDTAAPPPVSDLPPVSEPPPVSSTPPPISTPPPATSAPGQPPPPKPPKDEPAPTTTPTAPPPPSGQDVTGQLVTELPPGTPPPPSGGSDGEKDDEEQESASPAAPAPPEDPGSAEQDMLPVIGGLLISGILLSGGAFLELRNPFHRRFT